MEGGIYGLCSVTALACAVLLLRGYRRSGAKLLLWCALFFLALTLENALLFADDVTGPNIDLKPFRRTMGLLGALVLVYGLIWEVDRRSD